MCQNVTDTASEISQDPREYCLPRDLKRWELLGNYGVLGAGEMSSGRVDVRRRVNILTHYISLIWSDSGRYAMSC